MTILARFLRFFFRQLYHGMAWSYDWVAWFVSLGQWNQWIRSVIPFAQGDRILELGFGPGHLQQALQSQRKGVFGIDESGQMARQAKRRLLRHHLPGPLTRARAEYLPFPPEIFNSIVSTFPSEYIFAEDTLDELKRVLHPEGSLTVLIAAWITGKNPIQRLLSWIYQVTGQAIPSDQNRSLLLERFANSGFRGEFNWVETRGARLLLISLKKVSNQRLIED